ncbi:LOW QUALITY PROTEIN: cyclin-dependent kinase inhibitor 5-like [Dioscorea cayenensis subsp. rotundata]|uniref:Cyclin-dependent kinase inhibitor n=1 Tax=Dioscorea cayennensis subsp. rotundata TaxID=55577 RepID=A0AB40CDX8_DIOCR|nr:LOW QUALITY PROTEIN: cyclin-dependent kinase inhibitor 5-like [Dioscorea cayenensis subsp. rotundata]
MGKYMKKTKMITGEVSVMDLAAHQSLLGVRTRARTLALQRLQKPPLPEELEEEEEEEEGEAPSASSYLQLRSRRLEKPKPKDSNPNPRSRSNSGSTESARSCRDDPSLDPEANVEVSFGDNVFDAEARDRTVRETTPCSMIRNSESIRTPGSTTRPTNSTASSRRMKVGCTQTSPTSHEMEEFFSGAEQMQQRMFAEKYNFDPVNDIPLPGRYEWVKLDY